MRFKKLLVFGIAMLLIAMFMASCGGGGDESGKKKVVVGLTAPLSGIGGGYGEDIKAGIDMAIEDINAEGGANIGGTDYIFILNAKDDMAVPEQALANAQRLVLEEGINIIFDPLTNTITSLMDINTRPGEEFLIMSYTSVPNYESKPNKLMVQGPPPFVTYVQEYIKMAMGKGWKKVGMLQTTESYGVVWGNTFKQAWTAAGGSVVGEAGANYYTETDFTPYITKVLASSPDVLFIGGPSEPTALVVDQARSLGFKGGFICLDQAKLDGMADVIGIQKMEGAIGVLPVEQSALSYMPKFMQKYQDIYKKRVTWETCINYCMFYMLVDSMKIAGSVDDVQAIRAAFAKNSKTTGDRFPVEFSGIDDKTGQLYMSGQCGMVVNGQFQAQPPIDWWKL